MSSLLTQVLVVKEHIRTFYARYCSYIDKVMKLVLGLLSFGLINKNMDYMKVLNNPLLVVGMALICAFLPTHFIVFVSAVLLLLHLFQLSLEIAAITLVIILLMVILYIRFTPREAVVILLTPIAFALKIPYLVPLAMGLLGTPLSAVPVGCGVLIYFIIHNVKEYSAVISNADSDAVASKLSFFTERIFQDKQGLLTLIAFILIVILVYAVKRMSVDYSWAIAVVCGAFCNIILMLAGDFIFDVDISYITVFAGTLISALIAYVLQLLVFSVDYSRTERVQFEDDEYYYYVKAVPKMSMTVEDKQVKRINQRRSRSAGRRASGRQQERSGERPLPEGTDEGNEDF